jgi:hypothetical protein
MANEGFWKKEEVKSIKLWIKDLNLIGYLEPAIVNLETNNQTNKSIVVDLNYKIGDFDYTLVRYTPNFQISIDEDNYCCGGKSIQAHDRLESFNFIKALCSGFNVSLNFNTAQFDDSLNEKHTFKFSLLITFNHDPIEENILFLYHFYRNDFQNIIFCGVNIMHALLKARGLYKRFDSFTFIEVNTVSGNFHYFCMNKAIELGLNTEGFFLMSDDLLIKFWKLRQLDYKKIWFLQKKAFMYDFDVNGISPWPHWWGNFERMKNLGIYINTVFNSSRSQYLKTEEIDILKSYVKKFNGSLYTQVITKKFHAGSDWFYLPRSKFQSFHFISKLLRKFDVFLEVAVPYILEGLDSDNSAEGVSGRYEWGGVYFNFTSDYNKFDVFYHPFKLSWLRAADRKAQAGLYCSHFVQDKLEQSLKPF